MASKKVMWGDEGGDVFLFLLTAACLLCVHLTFGFVTVSLRLRLNLQLKK